MQTKEERLAYIKAWTRRNPEKRKRTQRKYRERHPDYAKIKQFLYGHSCGTKRGVKRKIYWGLLNGDGCCLICGDFYPFHLEQHHPFKESETQLTLCSNCHREFHRSGSFSSLETLEDYKKEMLCKKKS